MCLFLVHVSRCLGIFDGRELTLGETAQVTECGRTGRSGFRVIEHRVNNLGVYEYVGYGKVAQQWDCLLYVLVS
jgi:hypothetical protein